MTFRNKSVYAVLFALGAMSALSSLSSTNANADASSDFERAKTVIQGMSGCYLVDYSYSETEVLNPNYKLDSRVYDGSDRFQTKELVLSTSSAPNHVRLQHILFATDAQGKMIFVMKHTGEDWFYEPESFHEFMGDARWEPRSTNGQKGVWVRKITNLDDGPRYQCVAPWNLAGQYPEWSCSSFAPIPGRETRDMGRKDYNTLDRGTRLIAHIDSFLERQNNIKTIFKDGTKTPLVREVGKNWYVRQPDTTCAEAQAWAQPRMAYWRVLESAWNEALKPGQSFGEKAAIDGVYRTSAMGKIEDTYYEKVGSGDTAAAEAARREILSVIEKYRK